MTNEKDIREALIQIEAFSWQMAHLVASIEDEAEQLNKLARRLESMSAQAAAFGKELVFDEDKQ